MSHDTPRGDDASSARHLSTACAQVAHYAPPRHHAALEEALEALIKAHPKPVLPPTALAGLDQLHLGGAAGSRELLAMAALETPEGMPLAILEPGAGLGGLARMLVSQHASAGHHVTTLDLSESLCQLAVALNRATGLRERIRVLEGDACYPELHPALTGRHVDRILSQHLLVHLSDKTDVLRQWHDCLNDDGYLVLHEPVLSVQAQAFHERPQLPVPWALTPRADHLASCEELHEAMANSGFEVEAHAELTPQVLAWQARRLRTPSPGAPGQPPLSPAQRASQALTPELIFGPHFPTMQHNLAEALEAGWLEVHLWRLRKRRHP